MRLVKKVRNYYLRYLIQKSIWLEELTGKQHHFVHFLEKVYHDFFETYLLLRGEIYKLSDQFMKTEVFEAFGEKYKQKIKEGGKL